MAPWTSIPGRWVDVSIANNAQGFRFSGSVPHAVEAYLGERFSLVFYTTFSNRVLPEFHERALRQLGFPLPPPASG